MDEAQPRQTDLEWDEGLIQSLIQQEFQPLSESPLTDEELVEKLAKLIEPLYNGSTAIITLTGGPGSGKTTLSRELVAKLQTAGHTADSIITDDFNLYDRETRNRIAKETGDPLSKYDFEYMKQLVADVKSGKERMAPVYDDATGEALVVGEENFSHRIPAGVHFLLVEGDFQPIEDADYRIYFHVPTNVRRENRVKRDLEIRGWDNADAVRRSFDERLEFQYYPHTIKAAEKADLLITTEASPAENHKHQNRYNYEIFERVAA